MCGIAAFINEGTSRNWDFIKDALASLEYRGYDSCGYFISDGQDFEVSHALKKEDLFEKEKSGIPEIDEGLEPTYGLIHTRWADTGKASLENAHPIQYGDVYVVHNGNVNSTFKDTGLKIDTEIIARYFYHGKGTLSKPEHFLEVLRAQLTDLSGDFAFVIAVENSECLLFAKTNKRLCLSEDCSMLASDPACFYGYNDNYFELPENCYGVITRESVQIFNFDNTKIDTVVRWKVPHRRTNGTMLSEIAEQASLKLKHLLKKEIDIAARNLIFGCGSSYNAAMFARPWLNEICPLTQVEYASSLKEGVPPEYQNFIAISQSGETYDVIKAVENLKRYDCNDIVLLTNTEDSSLSKMVPVKCNVNMGTESAVAATKTFSATSWELASINPTVATRVPLEALNKVLRLPVHLIVDKIYNFRHCFVFGNYWSYGAALECALKLKEVALIHAEGMIADEIKHGPICLTGPDFLNIFLTQHRSDAIIKNMKQIKSRGGIILVLQSEAGSYNEFANFVVNTPDTGCLFWTVLLQVIFIQRISREIALLKNLNPDRPVGLAKAVTV